MRGVILGEGSEVVDIHFASIRLLRRIRPMLMRGPLGQVPSHLSLVRLSEYYRLLGFNTYHIGFDS